MIAEKDKETLRQRFAQSLPREVTVRLFTESMARSLLTIPGRPVNPIAHIARNLALELAELSPKIKLQVFDVPGDGAEAAGALKLNRFPAYVIGDDAEGRIRFYGTPVGNEFTTILDAIEGLSQGAPRINPALASMALMLGQQPIQLQVFVTPT
jgi:hypothetical protein